MDLRPRSVKAFDEFVRRHGIGSRVAKEGDALYLDRDGGGPRVALGTWEGGQWWPRVKALAPVTWYVDEMLAQGHWRQETIPAATVGLSRDVTVVRAARRGNLIISKWHGDHDTFCPPLWDDLAIGSGSCGQCRGCFLILTHRIRRDPRRHLLYDNVGDFWREAAAWLKAEGHYAGTRKASSRRVLGLGIDRSDSLLFEGVTGHARNLIPLFADVGSNPDGRRLVLLTKTANTHFLEGLATANVIVSMSLNPQVVADIWENTWPDGERVTRSIADRVAALVEAQGMGFEVRVRLDPVLPIAGWQDAYRAFVDECREAGLLPTLVTLGSYRQKNAQLLAWAERWGLPRLEWQPEDLVADGTHEHLGYEIRVELYRALMEMCREVWPGAQVGLCKETRAVRRALGLQRARCNCMVL